MRSKGPLFAIHALRSDEFSIACLFAPLSTSFLLLRLRTPSSSHTIDTVSVASTRPDFTKLEADVFRFFPFLVRERSSQLRQADRCHSETDILLSDILLTFS